VLRRRHDGYHDIETILQAIELFDHLRVTYDPAAGSGPLVDLQVEPFGAVPEDKTNLCWQAVEVFRRETKVRGGFKIVLRKTIPTEAGLGGGSSNAAAVLVACNSLCRTGLSEAQLERMGAEIGSDVPFFIRGGTQLGRGRGTELTRLSPIHNGRFLVIKPSFSISTTHVYNRLNMGLTRRSPTANIRHVEALIARFPTGSWFGINRLEEIVLPDHPVLHRLVQHLKEWAPIAMLSGSGAAVFAAFPAKSERKIAGLEEFVQPDWLIEVVGPHAAGVEFMDEGPTRPKF